MNPSRNLNMLHKRGGISNDSCCHENTNSTTLYWGYAKLLSQATPKDENPLYVRRVASGTRKVDTTQVPRSRSWTILRVESLFTRLYFLIKYLVVTSLFLVLQLVVGISQEVNHTIENKNRITQWLGPLSKLAPELESGTIRRLSTKYK